MSSTNYHEALDRYREQVAALDARMSDPAVLANPSDIRKVGKERSEKAEVLAVLEELVRVQTTLDEANEILNGSREPDLVELARMEAAESEARLVDLRKRADDFLFPRDPNDAKDVIVEIRAGTGGEEAALFASELYRMYTRWAERQGWSIDVLNTSETGIGGLKEVIFGLAGRGVYGRMKYESGVHRVQRVPATEGSGRIHTSAVTLAVMPEAEDVDITVDEKDLRVDVYRSSGPGGQGVNTTDSAVRITHIPTNTVVTCQDERSQIKNKAKAMKILRSRLLDVKIQEQEKAYAAQRKSQVSSGDRSAKIRTYNFPQSRFTDHRIGLTLYRLKEIMEGDLDEVVDALVAADIERRLGDGPAVPPPVDDDE
jgi:peptide chain release factor 1